MSKLNLLTIIFVILKLTGVISWSWSWFWVISPTVAFGLFWIGVFAIAFVDIVPKMDKSK